MATTSTHYRECAEKSLRAAELTSLANVRERHLHSARTWQAMAERSEEIEAAREERNDLARMAQMQKLQAATA